MDTKININLEKVFKGVFKHSAHDKENIAMYRVIIENLGKPDLVLKEVNVYFCGERQVEWPQLYTYRGHNYWVTDTFTEEDKERKDKNELGQGWLSYRVDDSMILCHIPIFFIEELYKP